MRRYLKFSVSGAIHAKPPLSATPDQALGRKYKIQGYN